MNDEQSRKRREAELRDLRRRLQALNEAYESLRIDYNKSLRYVDLLRNDIKAIFGSLTWRIGNGCVAVARRLTGRHRDPQAADHIRAVLQAFDAWQQPAAGSQHRPLDAFAAPIRRPCFDRSAPSVAVTRVGLIVGRRSDGEPTGSAWIRLLEPLQPASEDGRLTVESLASSLEIDDRFDVIVVQRAILHTEEMVDRLLDRCRPRGIAVIVDLDDDLLGLGNARSTFSKGALRALKKLIEAADFVTVSTSALRDRISPLNSNTVTIGNGIDLSQWREPDFDARKDSLRALYFGTDTHSADLRLIQKPYRALKGEGFELDIIGGFAAGEKGFGNRITVPKGKDLYPPFIQWLQQQNRWQVGLAPLVDTMFNQAKSPLKYLQYTALGLVTVASRVSPYSAVIVDGENGLLVDDSAEAWVTAIRRLGRDPELRQRLLSNARQTIALDHDLRHRTDHWLRLFAQARQSFRQAKDLAAIPFQPTAYLLQNADVARGSANPDAEARRHYDAFGQREVLAGIRRYHPFIGPVDRGVRSLDEETLAEIKETISAMTECPTISILMPVYKVDPRWLKQAIMSVKEQAYPHWQLCIVDDGSQDADIENVLSTLDDDRIVVALNQENQGIAETSNRCLSMATGEYIALLDHDDELPPHALFEVARAINEHQPDVLYSDEAKLDEDERIVEAHYKPDFSPEQVLAQNYISHLGVYRAALVHQVGGFRPGFEGSQDHDLLLRVLAESEVVVHIPRILYFWRQVAGSTAHEYSEKDYAWEAGRKAVAECVASIAPGSQVEKGQHAGTYRVRYPIIGEPQVSIIIPFRDHPDLLDQVLASVLNDTDYDRFEIIGVNNGSALPQTLQLMADWARQDARIRFVDYDRPFNFSAINNFAAHQANGQHILMLNNDITVDSSDWLSSLLEYSQRPDIGAVGGLLLYPDRIIQHAGVIMGLGGVAGHSHKHLKYEHHGYFGRPHVAQNVSAVTGACLMVKKALWRLAGGLNERDLTIAFNDIDFCLRLQEMGYLNVYTPHCRLIHHESRSRGKEDTPEKMERFTAEADYMRQRHVGVLCRGDRHYNPNLTLRSQDFSVRPDQWEFV